MKLHIDGSLSPDRRRFLVRIDNKDVWLPAKMFRYLTILAKESLVGRVYRRKFELSEENVFNVPRYMYRLKEILVEQLGEIPFDVLNDRMGHYWIDGARFNASKGIHDITFNDDNLKQYHDHDIRKMFGGV